MKLRSFQTGFGKNGLEESKSDFSYEVNNLSKVDKAFELLIISCIAGGIFGEYAIYQQWSPYQVLAGVIGATFLAGCILIHSLFVGKK